MQSEDPRVGAIARASHWAHDEEEAFEKVPRGHNKHVTLSSVYVPAGQGSHEAAESGEIDPSVQGRHVGLPKPLANVEATQGVQTEATVEPVSDPADPGGQGVH